MKYLSRRTFLAAVVSGGVVVSMAGSERNSRQLGEDLLRAAEQRDWDKARALLEQGADPNITSFTPTAPIREGDWRARASLERPSALSQAAAQGNAQAVALLLRHGALIEIRAPRDSGPLMASVEAGQVETARVLIAAGADATARRMDNHTAAQMAAYSGNHDLILLLEDAAKIPVHERNVPQVPFAPGGREARARLVAGTQGAVPLRHLLWASAREVEMLILRESPRRFTLLDLASGRATELPRLSERWAAQEEFDAEMLTTSPDGKWLLGSGGTGGKETWLATEIRGASWHEWPRPVVPKPAPRVEVRGSSTVTWTVDTRPPIAWMDGRRWVELASDGRRVARIRTLGSPEVEEIPIVVPGFQDNFPHVLFCFPTPAEGRLHGPVGFNGGPTGGRDGEGYFVAWLVRVVPEAAGWRMETREVKWQQADYAGFFHRCVPSPRGDRLAWLNHFSSSGAGAILITDAQGRNARIVYEHLYSLRDRAQERAARSWHRVLEWTPDGQALAFWRGPEGEGGLCLLDVPDA